jgi:hypothetical protein
MEPYLNSVNKAFADDAALAPPLEQLGARAQIEDLQKSNAAHDIGIDDHEILWKVGLAKLSIFRPRSLLGGQSSRLIRYLHGGERILGW